MIRSESEGVSVFEKRNNARNENFEPFGRPTSREGTLNGLVDQNPFAHFDVIRPFQPPCLTVLAAVSGVVRVFGGTGFDHPHGSSD